MKLPYLFVFLLLGPSLHATAQSIPAQAFENVTLHHADGSVVSGATIVWRGSKIEAVGKDIAIPFDARARDGGDSLHVYPGFIDGLALWGSPDRPTSQARPSHTGRPTYERAGIQPDRSPHLALIDDDMEFREARLAGFKTAAVGLKGFMLPGQVDLFNIRGIDTPDHVLRRQTAQLAQFGPARGVYPSTLMGMMARLRQLWHDAEALKEHQSLYASNETAYSFPGHDPVLEALFPVMDNSIPLYFAVDTKEDIERVLKLKDELGFDLVLVSGKEAYKMSNELASRDIPVLASIDMPEKPSWMKEEDNSENGEEIKDDEEISAEEQRFRERRQEAYENRATNIRSLMDADVTVGYASHDMALEDFRENLTVLMEYGLADDQIMAMLTQNTAAILGIEADHGDVQVGQRANFSVYSTPVGEEEEWMLKFSVSAGDLLRNDN